MRELSAARVFVGVLLPSMRSSTRLDILSASTTHPVNTQYPSYVGPVSI